jgi:lipid A ethanolaminephosphotransferase
MGLKLFRSTGHTSLLDARAAAAWQHKAAAGRNPLMLLTVISIWLATVGNWALWRALARLGQLGTLGDYAFAAAFAVIIFAGIGFVTALLAWRLSIKPLLTVLLLMAAFGMHFMLTYGIVIDDTMIVNVLQTNPSETRDLLNLRMLITVLLVAGLPIFWLWRQPVQRLTLLAQGVRNIAFMLMCALLVAIALFMSFQTFASTMRNHTQLRFLINPLNSIYALGQITTKPLRKGPMGLAPIGQDAKLANANPAKPPLLLLVVGETARSGNFSVNGYNRPTTPELAALMATERMVTQRNAWSCGTNTAISLPCMFNHLGREGYDSRSTDYESLLDVLQRAGLAVLWLENQSGCKGVCDRIANFDTTNQKVPEHCATGECFDAIMLHELDARIAALPAERRAKGVVVVMHQMGSHGPAYFKRVPQAFKKFTPECTSNALQDCSREQVTNSYDNTIAYTDHFLSLAIKWLKAQENNAQAAMLYVADHGESLGENNIYLHGLPYAIAPDVQKHVPWITWMSGSFAAASRIDIACLRTRANEKVSHDNYVHSVLGLMGVQSSIYKPELNLYAPCTR